MPRLVRGVNGRATLNRVPAHHAVQPTRVLCTQASFGKAPRVNALVVEAVEVQPDSPVLVFLHGAGEASERAHDLSLVLRHNSPPYQAIQGRLRGVTVVTPQAPSVPRSGWKWNQFVEPLSVFLRKSFAGRQIVAAGFSRGGLGVLQLLRASPDLVTRWAIVDPERAAPDEEAELLPPAGTANGWLCVGTGIKENIEFGLKLSERLEPENAALVNIGHVDLARLAFGGSVVRGVVPPRLDALHRHPRSAAPRLQAGARVLDDLYSFLGRALMGSQD